jgi:hypothetical protein
VLKLLKRTPQSGADAAAVGPGARAGDDRPGADTADSKEGCSAFEKRLATFTGT